MRPALLGGFRVVGVEDDLAGRGARRGRQAARHDLALGLGIDGRVQQLVEGGGVDAADRLVLRDQPLVGKVDGDAERSACAVRLPLRVCSIHSLPASTVNSMSCMSR